MLAALVCKRAVFALRTMPVALVCWSEVFALMTMPVALVCWSAVFAFGQMPAKPSKMNQTIANMDRSGLEINVEIVHIECILLNNK